MMRGFSVIEQRNKYTHSKVYGVTCKRMYCEI